ncbi:MAG: cyclohexanecarboxyl-CoA dehydrogenase [Chloroflexota bacterium]|nr:MAG: cyclohexanecarboxyl-CoA dehydrogenase [Chloroflexota bacterium]
MDFAYSEEEELFRKTVRQFAMRELLPKYAERDDPNYPPEEARRQLAQADLMGLRAPIEYGGSDASHVMCGVAVEEVARGDYNMAALMLQNIVIADVLARHAPKEIKEEWLPEMVAGRRICTLALTEPQCGSDAAALETKAERQGDWYVITGEKSSISNVGADACVLFARTSPVPGARGISALFVPLDAPGVGRSHFNDLGMHLCRRGALHFDGVRVPKENLIGQEGTGFYQVMNQFDYIRALLSLQCLGCALQSVEETIEYVKTRNAFGQPIVRFEGVAFPIAEAMTKIEAARLLSYKSLWLRDRGLPHTKETAMVKWLGPRTSFEVIHQMLLFHGHAGYSDDYPLGQRLRDVIGHEIGDGTAEIMKTIVAREFVGREFRPYNAARANIGG